MVDDVEYFKFLLEMYLLVVCELGVVFVDCLVMEDLFLGVEVVCQVGVYVIGFISFCFKVDMEVVYEWWDIFEQGMERILVLIIFK